jgi:type I restriction enzyme R subunit
MSAYEKTLNEKVVQMGVAAHISKLDWQFESVFLQGDLITALEKLNPEIAKVRSRADEVLAKLRAVLLGVRNDGLVASNEEFVAWICGRRTIKYIGTDQDVQVRLIDFDNPTKNILRVTTEATFHIGREHRRYDLVLWINGLPLVVGEMKTPVGVNISFITRMKKRLLNFLYPMFSHSPRKAVSLDMAQWGSLLSFGLIGLPLQMKLWLPDFPMFCALLSFY